MTVRDANGLVIPQSLVNNTIGYTGKIYDYETGLWHSRNRMYSPLAGRFLQRDPAGFVDGLNMYAYVRNNPVNLVDPTGLSAQYIDIIPRAFGENRAPWNLVDDADYISRFGIGAQVRSGVVDFIDGATNYLSDTLLNNGFAGAAENVAGGGAFYSSIAGSILNISPDLAISSTILSVDSHYSVAQSMNLSAIRAVSYTAIMSSPFGDIAEGIDGVSYQNGDFGRKLNYSEQGTRLAGGIAGIAGTALGGLGMFRKVPRVRGTQQTAYRSLSMEIKIARARQNSQTFINNAADSFGQSNNVFASLPDNVKSYIDKLATKSTGGGAARAAQYNANWKSGNLQKTIDKFSPGAKGIDSGTGKTIYTNPKIEK